MPTNREVPNIWQEKRALDIQMVAQGEYRAEHSVNAETIPYDKSIHLSSSI